MTGDLCWKSVVCCCVIDPARARWEGQSLAKCVVSTRSRFVTAWCWATIVIHLWKICCPGSIWQGHPDKQAEKLWWTDLTWQEEQAYYQTHDGIISTFILRNFSIRKSARLSSNDHHRGQYHVSLVQQNIYIFILVSPWLSTCSTLSAPVAIVTAMVQNQVLEGKSTVTTYPHWYSEFNASIYGQCMGTRLITLPPCSLSVTQLHKN